MQTHLRLKGATSFHIDESAATHAIVGHLNHSSTSIERRHHRIAFAISKLTRFNVAFIGANRECAVNAILVSFLHLTLANKSSFIEKPLIHLRV
jgi:hypothetical protein